MFLLGSGYLNQSYYSIGTGRISLSNVQCTGSEESLLNCTYDISNDQLASCTHDEDVGVACIQGKGYMGRCVSGWERAGRRSVSNELSIIT